MADCPQGEIVTRRASKNIDPTAATTTEPNGRIFPGNYVNEMSDLPSSIIGSKRKAGNDIASPPTQRPHPSQSESLTTYPPTIVRSLPEPDSIQAIFRDNCGIRLYVRPIAWTSNQLQLLMCRFCYQKKRRPQTQTQPARQDPGFNGGKMADSAVQKKSAKEGPYIWAMRSVNHLAWISTLESKKSAVKTILRAYDINPSK